MSQSPYKLNYITNLNGIVKDDTPPICDRHLKRNIWRRDDTRGYKRKSYLINF